MGTYDPPQNCQKLGIKYCSEEIWNEHLQNKHRNVDLKMQKVQKTINKGGIILNLKQFNTHKTYCHFKMESINQVIDFVKPNVYIWHQ